MRVRPISTLSLALVLGSVLAATTPAAAHNRPRSWEFGVFGGEMLFDVPLFFTAGSHGEYDTLLGTRDTEFFGLRLGYNFTPHWEVEFTHDDASTEDVGFKNVQRDYVSDHFTVNYNFLTTTERRVYPYLAGGAGRLVSKVTVSSKGDEDSAIALVLGGGFRLFLNKSVSFRVDGRWKIYSEQHEVADLLPDNNFLDPSLNIDDQFSHFEITIGLYGIIGGQR